MEKQLKASIYVQTGSSYKYVIKTLKKHGNLVPTGEGHP